MTRRDKPYALLVLDLRLIDWQRTRISSNDRLDKFDKAKREQLWQDLGAKAAAQVAHRDRCHVEVWYRFPNNIRREVSNLQPTSKAIVDGMVQQAGRKTKGGPRRPFVQIVPDDSDQYMVGPDNRRDPVNGPHQVIVRLFCHPDELLESH